MALAWEAVNENLKVFCASGKTPAKALKAMAKILKDNNIEWWTSAALSSDLEDHVITIYI